MKAAFDRRRQDDRVDAQRDRRRRLPDAGGRVLRLPVGQGPARPGATTAAVIDDARPSWPSTSSTRPRWRSCRARRSARRATCACPTRSATTTWSRASPGCRSSSPEPSAARPARTLPKAHLHLHFTGSMRHATLLELAERDGIALPDSLVEELAAAAVGGRREGLVPLPAALRRRAVGAAHRGRRTPAGAGGRRGRRPRRRPLAGDPGRPVAGTAPASAASPRSPTWCSTPCATPRRAHRPRAWPWSSPPTAPGTRSTPAPWPGSPRSTPAAAWSASGCPTTSGAAPPRTSRRPSRSPSGPGCCWCRTAASCSGPSHVRTCLDALHADRLGHGVRVGRGPRPARPDRRRAASRSRSARSPTSRSASTPTSRRCRCPTLLAAGATVALGRRRPAAVRLPAGRPVRHDARRPRPRPTTSWPSWPRCRSAPRGAPDEAKPALLADVDAWLAHGPDVCHDDRHERRATLAPGRAAADAPGSDARAPPSAAEPARQRRDPPITGVARPADEPPGRRPVRPEPVRPAGSVRPPPSRLRPAEPYGQPRRTGQRVRARSPYGAPADGVRRGARHDHPSATTALVLGIDRPGRHRRCCGGITLVLSPFAWVDRRQGRARDRRRPRAATAAATRPTPARSWGSSAPCCWCSAIVAIIGIVALLAAASDSDRPTSDDRRRGSRSERC